MLDQTVQLRIDFVRIVDNDVVDGRVFLRKVSGESMIHVAMKLASFMLYYSETLQIEKGVGQHFKPDLVIQNGDDISLWIDCGATAPKKLERIVRKNRNAKFVVFKPTPQNLARYRQTALRRVVDERVSYVSLSDQAVMWLAHRLGGRHRLAWTQSDGAISISIDDASIECDLFELPGTD